MADVKWIQIVTDVFDNRKIKQIERMPEGDAIIVVWFKILCLAGKCNKNGMIFFTDEIPYTEDMLATEFGMEQPQRFNVLRLALRTFEQFKMIEIIEDVYCVSSWERYQNIEGLEKIREQNRLRQARYKESKKMLPDNVISNVTGNAKVTHGNAIDIDIESDKDIDINIKENKHKFGEFGHVRLKESESTRLIEELGQDIFDKCIKRLDEYIQETGKKYKDHNLTIRRWVIDAVKQPGKQKVTDQPKQNKFNNHEHREYTPEYYAELERKLSGKGL
jgi:predicted phage replisome organizer